MQEIVKKINEKKLKNSYSNIDKNALYNLILRITGRKDYADKFEFIQIENAINDTYKMYDKNNKIVIEASCGVCAAPKLMSTAN